MFHVVHIRRLHLPARPALQRQGARGFKRIGKGSWKKPVACTNLKEPKSVEEFLFFFLDLTLVTLVTHASICVPTHTPNHQMTLR